jgi:DNA-3-methyladenine glycosylase I
MKKRCAWVNLKNDLYIKYHDEEWGVPLHDEHKLFEALILDGAQAGLSWETILKKRENYREAYDNFDPKVVAGYDEEKIQQLLLNSGIVRNKLKVRSSVKNAQVFLEIGSEFGSFDKYLWGFVKGKPIKNSRVSLDEYPVRTELSDEISLDLKKRGMSFVGSTIIYAMLQAIGMVNDHQTDCFRYSQV